MADEFEGFANSPVDKKGKPVDPRDVPAFTDESEAGKVRDASQSTESSIVAFKTEGVSTNGAPAAVVVPKAKAESDAPDDASDADAAGGKEDAVS